MLDVLHGEGGTLVQLSLVMLVSGIVIAAALAYNFASSTQPTYELQEFSPTTINNDDASTKPVLLSLIIPAYNEEERLSTMLKAAGSYLSSKDCRGLELLAQAAKSANNTKVEAFGTLVEWIVVNDGSTDGTSQVYEEFVGQQPVNKKMAWRLCTLSQNSGKGAAVQAGMLLARGQYCLMVDADGATDFGPGLVAVAQHAQDHEFVFGSRAASDDGDNGVQRSLIRRILQAGFHLFVVLVVGNSSVKDTQCGFKLFNGRVVPSLFRDLHLHRWAFDTELFVRAGRLRLSLKEVPVPWQEIEGSKLNTSTLNLVRVVMDMLRDMVCVRLFYTLGIWTIPKEDSKKER